MHDIYCYAWGYRSREAARLAFHNMCAGGEASVSELHEIRGYKFGNGKRFAIYLKGMPV
jgi:hypothetical protein